MNKAIDPKIRRMSPQFLVTNMSRSIEFYTDRLGFQVEFNYEDFYVGIIKQGYSIHLKQGQPNSEERYNKRHNEDLDLIFSVDEIEGLYEHLEKQSVDVIQPLREMPYAREFYIADPDGYIIAFMEEK